MVKPPTYTIAIPVYKRILGFNDAIESALAVNGCTEVIVVDDNSDHNQFREICQSYNDSRISYSRNPENLGVFGNWNKCFELSGSEFTSILCSDDLVDSSIYSQFLKAYESDDKIDVFFGSFADFRESLKDAKVNRTFKYGKMEGIDLLANAINHYPGFPVLSVMRTETMRKRPYVSKPHSGNDFLWIYTNAMTLNLFATDKPINYWRRHPEQDAILSQSITMDCWPLMYSNMADQLKGKNDYLAKKAIKKAKALILSNIINGFKDDFNFQNRLLECKGNIFIEKMWQLIDKDKFLTSLIQSKRSNGLIYNLGRVIRKMGFYPF